MEEKDGKIVVRRKSWRMWLLLIGAVVMTVGCLVLAVTDFRVWTGLIDTPYWRMRARMRNDFIYYSLRVIMGFGFFFSSYCIVAWVKLATQGKPVLVVDENGITDHSSMIAFGFIPWSDVKSITIGSERDISFIEVDLANPEQYLARLKGISRCAVRINLKMRHKIAAISLVGTGVEAQKLLPKLKNTGNRRKASEQSGSLAFLREKTHACPPRRVRGKLYFFGQVS